MLSHKQGVFLARLLMVGPLLALYAAISLLCAFFLSDNVAVLRLLDGNIWAIVLLYVAIFGDLSSLVIVYFVALKAFRDVLQLGRFALLIIASTLACLALNYSLWFLANSLSGGMLSF